MAGSAWAQVFDVTPTKIPQGETLKVTSDKAHSAHLRDRTITLFPQETGPALGLMPVPTLEKPGDYTLDFVDDKGAVLHSQIITVVNAHYRKQNIVIPKAIAGLKPSPGEQEAVAKFRTAASNIRYWKEPFQPPVPGCLTSPFECKDCTTAN